MESKDSLKFRLQPGSYVLIGKIRQDKAASQNMTSFLRIDGEEHDGGYFTYSPHYYEFNPLSPDFFHQTFATTESPRFDDVLNQMETPKCTNGNIFKF